MIAADGSPLQGAADDRAFAVYALADPTADRGRHVYIECRIMANGVWTLGVMHILPAAAYEEQAAKRDELLATLEDVHSVQAPVN